MDKVYHSVYGSHIEKLIDLKRQLGYKYENGARNLENIDKRACEMNETTMGITREFADLWSIRSPNEGDSNYYIRMLTMAQLSSFLNDLGISSYIPKVPPHSRSTIVPYIFSKEEMDSIFKACDNLIAINTQKENCLISVPAVIRFLYCTGLRINEALSIIDKDVNIEERYLRVRDSKNGKERIIPISDSLASVCETYRWHRNMLSLGSELKYFFVKMDGSRCSRAGISKWFKKCMDGAQIPYTGKNKRPRIHDLRHTFAVTALATMAEVGVDLYVALPVLSCYLGHQSLRATEHYVRLTSNMYPNLIKDVNMVCLNVFPNYYNHETN